MRWVLCIHFSMNRPPSRKASADKQPAIPAADRASISRPFTKQSFLLQLVILAAKSSDFVEIVQTIPSKERGVRTESNLEAKK